MKGAAHFHRHFGKDHIVTLATEHKCVLESCAMRWSARASASTYLPVEPTGWSISAALAAAIAGATVLVSVMAAHNEIGVMQPLTEIAALVPPSGVLFHTDAAQAVGKMPVRCRSDGARSAVDLRPQDLRRPRAWARFMCAAGRARASRR